jgi:protocatechuate 3,4-dioxygenase beta subunit
LEAGGSERQAFGALSEVAAGESGGLHPSLGEDSAGAAGAGTTREAVELDSSFAEAEAAAAAATEEELTGPRLHGRVVRAGGVGVPGARIFMRRAQSWLAIPADVEELSSVSRPGPLYETETDDEGRFELRKVEPGDLALAIQADGFAPLTRQRLPVPVHEDYDLGDFSLELGVRLSGKVTGPRGSGVEGVEVLRAVSPEGGFLRLDLPGQGIPVSVTDAEGRFEVRSLAPGSWHLIFDHPDYRIAELTGSTQPAGQTDPGLLVSLEAGLTIEGRVEGLDPVAQGPLRVSGRRDREQRSGAADDVEGAEKFRARHAEVHADGSFALVGLAPGQQYKLRLYRLRETEPGDPEGLPERWSAVSGVKALTELSGARQVLFTYREETSLSLRAVDAETGQALDEFVVTVNGGGIDGAGLLLTEGADTPRTSFPGGVAKFEHLRPSEGGAEAEVRVRAEGYADFERKGVMLQPGEDHDLGEVKLERASFVRVRVVEKESRAPIPGAHVVLARSSARDSLDSWLTQYENRPWNDGSVRDAMTDEQGFARVTVWPDSICVVKAAAPGYLAGEEQRSVIPHEELVELELDRGGRVTVHVEDGDGEPIAGMYVEHQAAGSREFSNDIWFDGGSEDAKDRSNEQGVVVFADLAEGKHSFKVLEKRDAWGGGESAGPEAEQEVYLALGERRELVLKVAARGGYRATLLEGGEPLAGGLATLTPLDGAADNGGWWSGGQEDPRTKVSDHAGRVSFRQLKVGIYKLRVSHPERRMAIEREVSVVREPTEEVLDIGLACIAGRVVDTEGEPIRGVDIVVQQEGVDDYGDRDYRVRIVEDAEGDADWNYNEVRRWAIQTDELGEYVLRGVRPGCRLQLQLSDRYVVGETRKLTPLGADEYRAGEDFVLARAGALRVTVSGMDRKSRTRLRLSLSRTLESSEGGEAKRVRHGTSIRGWRPRADLNSLLPGTWQLKLTMEGSDEPLEERDVQIVAGERAQVSVRL